VAYTNTFILESPDCPPIQNEIPMASGDKKPMDLIQYELLTAAPYQYNHEEFTFEVYVRQKGMPLSDYFWRNGRLANE
jgi:hypothetical protein